MFPIIGEIAGFRIYSYGFFIAAGYLSALVLGRWLAKGRGLDPAPFMDLALIAIVSGVVGARLFYVLQNIPHFYQFPGEILNVWNGGLVFYGGFLLAAVVCPLFAYWKKMPFCLSADIVLAGVALAHGFGRIGCFAAGCCYGSYCPYPWGMRNSSEFVDEGLKNQPLHPVQLYESLSLFLLALLMARLISRKKTQAGTAALVYLSGYASIRFVTEFFRGDLDRGFVGGSWLSASQGIALVFLALVTAVFAWRFGSGRRFRSVRRNL